MAVCGRSYFEYVWYTPVSYYNSDTAAICSVPEQKGLVPGIFRYLSCFNGPSVLELPRQTGMKERRKYNMC